MPEWTKSPDAPIRISLLLFDRFSNLCLANCIEPLRAANTLAASQVFNWSILTLDGSSSRSSSGIDILPQNAVTAMQNVDYLFILASYGYEAHDTAVTYRVLRMAARKTRCLVGFDAAPWLLASAGFLNGRRATVHWDLIDRFSERFLQVETERARVVRDGACITCAGAMSALEMTLDLISEHLGMAARLDVEALFLQGDPPVQESGFANLADPLVQRGLDFMRDRIEKPATLTELARALSCQPRTLERRFRKSLGATPGAVYRH
ncbi:MAG: DJ-1/PfpI family protein, partial [Pseudomonadota bacterium]